MRFPGFGGYEDPQKEAAYRESMRDSGLTPPNDWNVLGFGGTLLLLAIGLGLGVSVIEWFETQWQPVYWVYVVLGGITLIAVWLLCRWLLGWFLSLLPPKRMPTLRRPSPIWRAIKVTVWVVGGLYLAFVLVGEIL